MSAQMRKIVGLLATMVALVFEGAIIAVTAIGMTTTADDAAGLPQWVIWLTSTPWWVPAFVIPVMLVGFATWALLPDFTTRNEIRKLRINYKESNDKAWSFSAQHQELIDEVKWIRADVAVRGRRLNQQGAEYIKAATEEIRSELTYATSETFRNTLSVEALQQAQNVTQEVLNQLSMLRDEVSVVQYTASELERVRSQIGLLNDQLTQIEHRLSPNTE